LLPSENVRYLCNSFSEQTYGEMGEWLKPTVC
jgi:hypothetical protein